MEYRSEELSSLESSKDYSPIFKVVLRDGQGEEEEDEEPTYRKRGGCCIREKVLVCGCGWVCITFRANMLHTFHKITYDTPFFGPFFGLLSEKFSLCAPLYKLFCEVLWLYVH